MMEIGQNVRAHLRRLQSIEYGVKKDKTIFTWQNGKVERSHREDGKILYGRKVFTSEKRPKKISVKA